MDDVKISEAKFYTSAAIGLSRSYVQDKHPEAYNVLLSMVCLPLLVNHKYERVKSIFSEYCFTEEDGKLFMLSNTNAYISFVYDERGAWLPASKEATTYIKITMS